MPGKPETTTQGLLALPPFRQVAAQAGGLARKQRRLAQGLLDRPEEFAFGSIREVAQKFDVNAGTITRFAQALGYDGYPGLQASVRDAYLAQAGLAARAMEGGVPKGGLETLRARQQANLAQVYQSNSEATLDAVAEALLSARRVLVTGDSVSAILAALFVRLLVQAGLSAEVLPAGGVDRTVALAGAGQDDLVVGLGLWLTFKPAVETLAAARRLGSRTVVIAGSPSGPLAREGDLVLFAPAQGQAISFSTLATVAVMEMVVTRVVAQRPERAAAVEQLLHDEYLREDMVAPIIPPHR
jgi:DNA-binding MurR/RpiR family transcriptional regulator